MIINLLKNTYAYANSPVKPDQIYLSASQLANRLGLSRTSIWRYLKNDPLFPRPVVFGKQTRRWKLSEVQAWENFKALKQEA